MDDEQLAPCRRCSTPVPERFGWCPDCERIERLEAEVRRLRDGIHNVNGWLVDEADAGEKVDADTLLLMLSAVLDGDR